MMQTAATASRSSLQQLEGEVLDFIPVDAAPVEGERARQAASAWSAQLIQLADELKRAGFSRQLSAATIGRPSDGMVISVLRQACRAADSEAQIEPLNELLIEVLGMEERGRERFRNSLALVLKRLTLFAC